MRRWARGALPWLVVVPGAVWAIVRLGGWDQWYPATQLIAFTPYVALASPLAVLIAALMRHRPAAAVAGLTALTLTICVTPRGLPDRDPLAGADGRELRVLTANVRAGRADAAQLVEYVRSERVDVLAIQELTQSFVAKLDRAGIAELLPHRVVYPYPGVIGSGVYSREPLRDDGVTMNPHNFGQVKAELLASRVLIESVHPVAPADGSRQDGWRRSFANQQPATIDGPLRVLAGDFNATLDHSLLRTLISSGYRDAAAVVGKGFTGTWGPWHGNPIPPVVLDRVLADRRIGVRDVRVFGLTGSDHRAVLAILVLP
ncbi:endonuclease/exonuclease/phosphatase family protein [Allorhizocola rhizosphaerae]|uniref:endonuclease/exonuclease/phosphatase family protein n=1 Tax=Allorhizocola rhizosphaerae TaxID=1872709 RepID=UPI000E3ED861|nr:endonuclease/exonuclease/phosphatase family protein [Allorhizocola rhizosphaerae]